MFFVKKKSSYCCGGEGGCSLEEGVRKRVASRDEALCN